MSPNSKRKYTILWIIQIILTAGIAWLVERNREKKRSIEREKKEKEERKKRLENERKRKELEERQKNTQRAQLHLDSTRIANAQFELLVNQENGYFTDSSGVNWRNENEKLFHNFSNIEYRNSNLNTSEINLITEFLSRFKNIQVIRKEYNEKLVQTELENYRSFFDDVGGKKLDPQQRRAVVINEDNNLVIAGAGTGKTTTMVAKVHYLMKRYKVRPTEILAISFTSRSASDLKKRINSSGVHAKTFHKFGKDVIHHVEQKVQAIFPPSEYLSFIIRQFKEQLNNVQYTNKVNKYFLRYIHETSEDKYFENRGQYMQYLKDQNFKTYQKSLVPRNGEMTLLRETVKSAEECRIANFLFLHNVKYKYEELYEFDTGDVNRGRYFPDFSIYANNQRIYYEHFALTNRSNDIPKWFCKIDENYQTAKNRYLDKIQWARVLHAERETILIETYSYEMSEGTLFANLKTRLEEHGIYLQPKSPQEIWTIIEEVSKDDELRSFYELIGTFITLMKSNNYSFEDVERINSNLPNKFQQERNGIFLEIIKPIYAGYIKHLKSNGRIDFSDMINKATEYIQSRKYNHNYRYILIDEFQDISISRYQLIRAIKETSNSCQLFCVGDDWQSIFRFAGSDIALFKYFEKYFGTTEKSKIETTYRYSNPLLQTSSAFIQQNPNQERKQLKSVDLNFRTDYHIKYVDNGDSNVTRVLEEIFEEICIDNKNIDHKEIIILGRYNFNIEEVTPNEKVRPYILLQNENTYQKVSERFYKKNDWKSLRENEVLEIEFKTMIDEREITKRARYLSVHKAKGLEADIVIVLGCNSGKHGFPSLMSDDPVLNLLLSEADQFENGEERRLFYVAMTRAKTKIFLLTNSSFKSKFIVELEVETGTGRPKCPECGSGDVVLTANGVARNGTSYRFYGCSNFRVGCEYKKQDWDN